ncbi:protein nedd1 [Chrysochromulina tobinii]|uniref:Protein nedd1 n=1 Tax=Chrysochromulina tobinii TaxID=1460289 RepID=A0A0M0K1C1_9EUKA|nr:protein nedd1 [Chrysochromulina tobinii]|eukprot:KOO32676.1 protein nedd1 [Chrysochromulina sp. CCMP291]
MSAIPLIATASDDEVSLWEGGGGEEPLATFEPHLEPITALRWTSNDRVLASASHDGTIALSEPSGKLFHTLQAQPSSGGASSAVAIHAITWSPGSRYLAAGGSDAVVRIFDLQKRAQALALRGHRAAVRGLSWSPSEVYVASSSDAGEIIVHRVQGSVAAVARIEHPAAEGMVRPGLGAVQWAPFHPSMLACAAADGGVAVWEVKPNMPAGPPHRLFAEHTEASTGLQWSPVNQHLLASCSMDATICFYDVTKQCVVRTLRSHRPLTCLAFASSGVHLALGSTSGELFIFDLRSDRPSPSWTVQAHTSTAKAEELGDGYDEAGDGDSGRAVAAATGRFASSGAPPARGLGTGHWLGSGGGGGTAMAPLLSEQLEGALYDLRASVQEDLRALHLEMLRELEAQRHELREIVLHERRESAELRLEFPDGVTHAMLFGGVAHRAPKEDKSWLVSSRHATADAVLELVVLALLGPTMLHVAVDAGLVGCSEAKASRGIVHALSEQRLLSLVGTSLLAPGRRLRLTGTAVAEVAANGDGALLLLPTPHAMLIAEPSFDRELLQSAASRTRGLSLAPDATLLLRLSHVTALETHAGRHLVRVLLHVPGRPCTPAEGEVEAELLLWNEEVRLGQLLPEHALLCVRQPELLTIGDAAVGGAPSQLGYAAHTLLLIVDESVPPSTVTAAGGGELRAFEGMRSDRGREARACEHERVAAGGMCLGRLMAPPQWQPGWTDGRAGGPLVERGGAGDCCSFVPVRLQLSDGLFGEFVLECAAREAVLEQLLDASAADLAPLPADEQRRSLDKQLCTERVWALTRAPSHGHGGAHLWTVNLTAPLDAVCPG